MSSINERLPQSLLDAIAPHGLVRSFPPQAILINEGDTTDSLYIVLRGRVKVYASSQDGREVARTPDCENVLALPRGGDLHHQPPQGRERERQPGRHYLRRE